MPDDQPRVRDGLRLSVTGRGVSIAVHPLPDALHLPVVVRTLPDGGHQLPFGTHDLHHASPLRDGLGVSVGS